MKKLLIGIVVLAFLAVLAGAAGLYYIKPERQLDLEYAEVPLEQRAIDMARRMSMELILTSDDIRNLAVKSIADNPLVEEGIRVTGADFKLEDDRLIADLNVVWKEQVPASLQVTYRLSWSDPNVVAKAEEARLKGISLPLALFADRVIPIADQLPRPLRIEAFEWSGEEVKVRFRKPSLSDLQQLIGGSS